MGIEKAGQVHATGFLFALQQDRNRNRQFAGDRLPGAAGLDKGHELAFVVGGAAASDDLRAIGHRLDRRVKGIAIPELERIDRLHIVMTVEQRRGAGHVAVMRHDHRVPRCRAHRGVEANALEVGHVPFGIGHTFGLVNRIGRNRLDAQDREQTLESRIEICVDVGQDIIELGHGALRRVF